MSNKAPEVHYDFQAGTQPVVISMPKLPRIGIYGGSFDPVHAGHIAFALHSQKAAGLEQIYFVPERRPRHGGDPEHYVHRSVMLQNALQPYTQFHLLDLPDAQLTNSSLARVIATLPEADYSLLTTAGELLWHQGPLPTFYHKLHLVIAVTSHEQTLEVLNRLATGSKPFASVTFVDIGKNHVSSANVRAGMRAGRRVRGVLPSVWRYTRKQWLYLPPIHR